ncbi:translation initiation factor eIF-2B subunit family protein [Aspergillus steynii IBT 23096]|uniref:Translation initiation factor eIF-2B subunit family protein n=1 Tax=Aspergillus steynii IBT 23096 TaxID=1392250 RepID=A0A2I2G3H2_9EURO|nr:translation initiation factor eIF-2B subunit family protein [Aspergillus steynii IBT 23096]PLB47423.1 translation initiation factor eIF-2B subunit family protein [Aspergillus steynii IBT 23096]
MATNSPSTLEHRDVVSSFIFHFPPSQPNEPVVALFRRSDKVNTYKHHLAPISGTISRKDKDPLTAAWRELQEETTLTPSSLSLWRTGKPFTFSDPSVNREWTIHPFAFRLADAESAIKIDWEHEGWEWHDPRAVSDDESFGGVPRLMESLHRVWFEGSLNPRAGKALATGLERLRSDHESGANELTAIALAVFRDFIMHTRNGLDESWWSSVRMVAWHLVKNGRESMAAAILNAVLSVLTEMEDVVSQKTDQELKWDRILAMMDFQVTRRTANTGRIMESFTEYLRSKFLADGKREQITILTMSASSTIRDSILNAFAALDVHTLELRVLESRPLFEGASIASSVLCQFKSQFEGTDKQLNIKVYTDASAALAAQDAEILLLGADRISARKGVSNKTGSLPVVLSVKHITSKAQVVVLSGLEKINGTCGLIDDDTHEDNGPREVVHTWKNDGIKGMKILQDGMDRNVVEVKNVYFEWVPSSLVDAFVCEDGILDVETIREKSTQLGMLADRYFGDL